MMPYSRYASGYLLFPTGSDGNTNARYYWYRNWNAQRAPYVSPCEFQYGMGMADGARWTYSNPNVGGSEYPDAHQVIPPEDLTQDAINRCYGKFVDNLGASSQFANNLLEARESVRTIETRALQLTTVAKALRRGNIGKAINSLVYPHGGKPSQSRVAKAKNLGNQWLELHFGWVPMVQDIHNACQTMSKADFGTQKLRASSSVSKSWYTRSDTGVPVLTKITSQNATFSAKLGAMIRITNPNAYLANQLGLVNPASIAWEAVPFSFVADWFGNVGQVLSSMSDFVGLSVENAYTTTSWTTTLSHTEHRDDPTWGGGGTWRGKGFYVHRVGGIAGPALRAKPFHGFSAVRGATAISLLLQHLRS
ncbi:MAG: maturation protein [Sanya fiers-like virus 1]|nr:MAG: maturation protein [Sanya fiers-like virus 1]UYL94448.1 MAG: maturation protein [Sanya fiers-like virus 1]